MIPGVAHGGDGTTDKLGITLPRNQNLPLTQTGLKKRLSWGVEIATPGILVP
jgi:hypothetical protein